MTVVVAALHGMLAATSGSLAATAELIHNFTDLLGAGAVLMGLKLAARKSRAFPYGLYKVENMVAAGLAVAIFFSAYGVASTALRTPVRPVHAEAWMLPVLAVTTGIPLVFSRFELRAGQMLNPPALIADAREYRVHAYTTGLVFVSLVATWSRVPLDRVAALAIVAVISRTGWTLLVDAVRVLLDASLDADTLLQIRTIIDGDPATAQTNWVVGRSAGRFRFVEAGVVLRGADRTRAEVAAHRIEDSVRATVPHIERVLVHVEPGSSPFIRMAVPLADVGWTLSPHFGGAPYFALVSLRRADGFVEKRELLPNPFSGEKKAKGIRVAEWLAAQKIDVVLTSANVQGKGPAYVLRDAGIELHASEGWLTAHTGIWFTRSVGSWTISPNERKTRP